MQERSDEQLMTAVMAGDQVALAALVTRHHAPLLGYLYRLVGGDRQLSEDLVQETLLHVGPDQSALYGGVHHFVWVYHTCKLEYTDKESIMNITALTSTGQQTRAIQHSRPRLLLSVMTWEFRRFRASRLFW